MCVCSTAENGILSNLLVPYPNMLSLHPYLLLLFLLIYLCSCLLPEHDLLFISKDLD